MGSNLEVMAAILIAMASNLEVMASNLLAAASTPVARGLVEVLPISRNDSLIH